MGAFSFSRYSRFSCCPSAFYPLLFFTCPPLRSAFTSVCFCAETGIHSHESAVSLALAKVLFNPRVLLAGKEEKFQLWAANQSPNTEVTKKLPNTVKAHLELTFLPPKYIYILRKM